MNKIIKYLIVINLFLSFDFVHSNEDNKLKIFGNNRVSNETIYNIVDFDKNKNLSFDEINRIQKKLFASNFFKDVKVDFKNNLLSIYLIENPLIDFFYIEGIKEKKIEDFVYSKIELGPNKIYSDFFLNSDLKKIKEIYNSLGYLDAIITPKISKLANNNLNVIINVERGSKYKINEINFIGDKYFSSANLKNVVTTSEDGWWKFFNSGTIYSSERIEFDKALLKNYYLDNGFYDVQILSVDTIINNKKGVKIIFSINSGKLYKIRDYAVNDVDNNLSQKDQVYVETLFNSLKDSLYSKKRIVNLKNDINEYLNNNKQFVNFQIIEKKLVDIDQYIGLELLFKNEIKQIVNRINITGNDITNEEVIRRDLLFAEGDTLSKAKIDESKKKLLNLGIFKEIKFKKINVQNELVNIVIDVEEQPTGSLGAGLGVGSSGASLSTNFNEKNLFGKGINLNSNFSLGTEKISGVVSTDIPDFNNNDYTRKFTAFAISTDYENSGYESTKAGFGTSSKFEIYKDYFLTYGLGLDRDDISVGNSASDLYKSREGNYMTYKGYYSLINNKLDNNINPTKGYKLSFGQGMAVPGSDIMYINNDINGSYYYPISKNYIFKLKSGISSINSLDDKDIKLSDRLFLTSKNLRGFESYGVGPKDGADHVGGNYSFYTSISTTVPNFFPDKWNADTSIFLDNGNVWGADYNSEIDNNKLRSSAGVSLNWTSPIGPISFSLSQVLSSDNDDIEESFNFQLGSVF